jgi:hypothetical protein
LDSIVFGYRYGADELATDRQLFNSIQKYILLLGDNSRGFTIKAAQSAFRNILGMFDVELVEFNIMPGMVQIITARFKVHIHGAFNKSDRVLHF